MRSNFPSRRTLLRTVSLAAASVALLPKTVRGAAQAARVPADGATPVQAKFTLGLASYTFRKFTAAQVIGFMKDLKCTHLNVKDFHLPMTPAADVASRADALRAGGLIVQSGGTVSFQSTDPAEIRAKFDYCKAAGITTMIAAPTHETLPLLEPLAKQYKIRVAVHNHGPEDKFFPSPLDVLHDMNGMSEWMGCCVDVGHTMRAGDDVPRTIRTVGKRLFDVHMKDLADAGSKESQVAVGDGIMPVPAIFRELARLDYTGGVDLEYEIFPEDPMPGVIKSLAYMRGVLAGLGYRA